MTDKKLDKLIEAYVEKCIFYYKNEDLDIEISRKAKKAIIDYVEKEKQKAANNVRDAFMKAINDMGKSNKSKPVSPEA